MSGPGSPPESPLHGFQGNRLRPPVGDVLPAGLAVAVSREAGARGGTIARRVGRKLGWQVYNQELLDYISQEGAFRDNLFATLPARVGEWADQRVEQLVAGRQLSEDPGVRNLARTILAVSSPGEVVLLGRGAGCILPRESTLHVRIMAPRADRIAYMAQWLRLTVADATDQVRLRDDSREHFLRTHCCRDPNDIYQYDLLLNSTLLREDLCVDLIVQAAKAKQAARAANPTTAASSEGMDPA